MLAACGAESSDEGMYKLALTLRTQDSTPLDSLPTTISWSSTTDLALRFIDAQHARVEVFGQRVDPDPYPVRESHSPVAPDGTLYLAFGTAFRVTFDPVACPQTYPTSLHGSTVLFFLDGHVHGETSDDLACTLPGDLLSARFFFDITGERVAE